MVDTGTDGAVAKSSTNRLVGTGFASLSLTSNRVTTDLLS